MPLALSFAVVVGSYLLGAIPFGYLIFRLVQGGDIRKHGSGNIGATNVARFLGWRFFLLVFVLDAAKGALPVLAARWLAGRWDSTTADPEPIIAVLAGAAALIGHMWPIYLSFRGGKGVATGAGIIVVLVPLPALFAVITWAIVAIGTRYVALGSMAAAIALCLARLVEVWRGRPSGAGEVAVTVFCVVAALLIIARHHGNIRKLWAGAEELDGQREKLESGKAISNQQSAIRD